MVALVNLPYPFATFISYKAHRIPGKTMIQSSIRVPSPSLRRARRKNYLRRKILRTLTKPLDVPRQDSIVVPFEPNEKLDSSIVESEMTVGLHDSGLKQEEVGDSNLVVFEGFSGRTIIRIVGSFVGLFILQTIVSVWIMGSSNSDGKDEDLVVGERRRDRRLAMREEKVESDGNGFFKNWAGVEVAEPDMKAKISEIRKMASEVREAEKRRKVENGESELDDVSDDEGDDESVDIDTDSSRFNSAILKEVDGRLSRLRERYSSPLLKVNSKNTFRGYEEERKDTSLNGKKDNSMLLFKVKPKFTSDLTSPTDKPRGFPSMDGVRRKQSTMNGDEFVKRTGSSGDIDYSSTYPEKDNSAIDTEKKIPTSSSSTALEGSRQRFGRNTAERRLEKGMCDSSSVESNGTARKLHKGMTESIKLKSSDGNIVDETDNNDRITFEGPLPTRLSTVRDAQEHSNPWWSKLPYVLVILMQKGIGSEEQRGFYNFRIYNDAENQSYCSYTVAFEDQNDAKNLSFILESEFDDEPDAAVEVAPLSRKDFKEVVESLNSEVIVLRKGELKLYAGQPLADVEDALRSLVK